MRKSNKKIKTEWSRVFSVIRRDWSYRNSFKYECLKNAIIPGTNPVKRRCAKCLGEFALSEVQCDHIVPVGKTDLESIEQLHECIDKLLVQVDKLQCLCHSCHKIKTKQDLHTKKFKEKAKKYEESIELISKRLSLPDYYVKQMLYNRMLIKQCVSLIENLDKYNDNPPIFDASLKRLNRFKEKHFESKIHEKLSII